MRMATTALATQEVHCRRPVATCSMRSPSFSSVITTNGIRNRYELALITAVRPMSHNFAGLRAACKMVFLVKSTALMRFLLYVLKLLVRRNMTAFLSTRICSSVRKDWGRPFLGAIGTAECRADSILWN